MLKINMGIVKLFTNDRNSFPIEERVILGLNSRLMNESKNEHESIVILRQQTEDNDVTPLTPMFVVNLLENTTDTQQMRIQTSYSKHVA